MLTYNDLVSIEGALRDRTVLTVYVNGEERDPSRNQQWRLELRHALGDLDRWLSGSSHDEREAFTSCRARVEGRLTAFHGTVRSPGWVGFFTTAGEFFASPLPVATPTMAVWSTGPSLAPCVRVLKEARPVIVALVDNRTARLYRYADRTAVPVQTIHARFSVEAERHMGRPPGAGFHVGTRGPTRRDRTQRELRNATTRMLVEVAVRVSELAGRDGWILVGGNATVARATIKGLRSELAHRAAYVERLTTSASPAVIGTVARSWASRLRNENDERSIEAIVAGSESDGPGTTGEPEVTRALDEGSVRALYFTPRFMARHAAEAESIVRKALSTRALVEFVNGVAAQRLDRAGGIAAALRYPSAMPTRAFAVESV
jgi:hypothetical protein